MGRPGRRALWGWGGATLLILALVAAAPALSRHDPNRMNIALALRPPSAVHWFGTDEAGRDILSRVLHGGRESITAALVVIAAALAIGIVIGALAGWFRGTVDEGLMRATDLFFAFPPLVLAMAISAALGPSLTNAVIAAIVVWWPTYARLVRAEVLRVRENLYVEAGRALGLSDGRLVLRHVLPQTWGVLNARATVDVGYTILFIATLGFVGPGLEAPDGRVGRHDRRRAHVLPGLVVDDDVPRPGPVRDRDLPEPPGRRHQRHRRPPRPESVGEGETMPRGPHIDPWPHVALVARALGQAGQPRALFGALDRAMGASLGHRLFTVLRYHPDVQESERLYTSQGAEYPVGGRKTVRPTPSTARVFGERRPYIGRTAADIRACFGDAELILSLGCESVLNLPVLFDGRVLGTVNLLHEAALVRRGRSAARPHLRGAGGAGVPGVHRRPGLTGVSVTDLARPEALPL